MSNQFSPIRIVGTLPYETWGSWHPCAGECDAFPPGSHYSLRFAGGAFSDFDGQTRRVKLDHAACTGLTCALRDTPRGLQVSMVIDPLVRLQGRIANDVRAGRICGFSPGLLFREYESLPAENGSGTLIVCYKVRSVEEISLVRRPAQPRFSQTEFSIEEVKNDSKCDRKSDSRRCGW